MKRTEPVEFVATDLEGTLSNGVTWEGMRDYLLAHGYGRPYRRFFFRQLPGLVLFRLGIGDDRVFKEQWILRMLRLFDGFSEARFREMVEWVVSQELWPNRRREVVAELRQHGQKGRSVIVVSGQFQPLLDEFIGRLSGGEAEVIGLGTPLRMENEAFTGEIDGVLNVGQQKVARLEALLAGGRLAAAYGDTRRDIPMLELAAEPVAVHPDQLLREVAIARGWRILEHNWN